MATNEQNPNYNEAIEEIETILAKMENDEMDVDQLADNVKRAVVLINFCREKLTGTKEEVEKILKEFDK